MRRDGELVFMQRYKTSTYTLMDITIEGGWRCELVIDTLHCGCVDTWMFRFGFSGMRTDGNMGRCTYDNWIYGGFR